MKAQPVKSSINDPSVYMAVISVYAENSYIKRQQYIDADVSPVA
jgi:hypothetical protein